MQFEFATASRIVFGAGAAKSIPEAARTFGSRPLIVTGRRPVLTDASGPRFIISAEPTIQTARDGVALFRREHCDVVIAVGGGSVIDAAKAISGLAPNSGEPLDYLEVVGLGKTLDRPAAPMIAVPTTSGTGSEVTRNAVLGVPEHGLKASLRSATMLPRLAVIDPELSLSLPTAITASTGLDALTQLIEPYVCLRANPMTDMYCLDGLARVARSLRRAVSVGSDIGARTDMSFASLLGGLALANAGLGVVHGFAAPIGGKFDAPHGAVCAALLPHGISGNLRALRRRDPEGDALSRYRKVAAVLTGYQSAEPEEAIGWITRLCADLAIPGLASYGVREPALDELVEKAANASSMKANPIRLTSEELREVVSSAL